MIVDASEQSKQDVLAIAQGIAEESPRIAIRFLDCIESSFTMLGDFPQIGHIPYFDFIEGLKTIPVNSFPSYSIFYRVLDDVVRIDRVAYGKRDLPKIFELENLN